MISRHEYHGGVWVDLEKPTQEEIRSVATEFSISENIERELLLPTPIPLVAAEEGATLLVLHFSTHSTETGVAENQEVDFVVGKHFILTVRYEVIAPVYHLKKLLETQSMVAGKGSVTTDMFLEILFLHLYTSVRDHTNNIAARLEKIEHHMFDGNERATIHSISNINREFLHVAAALANQDEPLTRFLRLLVDRSTFGPAFKERAERILSEVALVTRLVATHRAVATELRETNSSLLEVRQNEIMKTLTLITVVILPLELIAAIYKIHAGGTPLIDHPNLFWILIGIMGTVALLMTLFFVRKRWLF